MVFRNRGNNIMLDNKLGLLHYINILLKENMIW